MSEKLMWTIYRVHDNGTREAKFSFDTKRAAKQAAQTMCDAGYPYIVRQTKRHTEPLKETKA